MSTNVTPEAVLDMVTSLKDTIEKQNKSIDEITKSNDEFRKNPFGSPHARKGEDPLSSRGYSMVKALGVLAGHVSPENAKVECEVGTKLKEYHSGHKGYAFAQQKSLMVPMAADHLVGDNRLACEIREVTKAGVSHYDPAEVAHFRTKLVAAGYTKALSWLDESVGGALVGPPAFGELIEVLRNNQVLMAAGCKVIPMPPTGRMIWPRQTTAMTAYHNGESTQLTESTPGTGDVNLSAKKLTTLAKLPNELFHFSSIPIEAFVREDMGKVMALRMDVQLLEGVGSTTAPKGLINYSNINTQTSNGTPASANAGYPIHPRDPYEMIAKVEEQNATFRAFIMRPLLWSGLVNKRADAITAGDGAGAFLFNVWREPSADMSVERLKVGNLSGYPVFKSTQVSKTRTRGSAVDLTYVLGGDFQDYLLALSPAIEFAVSNQGDTPFTYDQTWYKGVAYYDGAPRHEASFVLMDQMTQSGF